MFIKAAARGKQNAAGVCKNRTQRFVVRCDGIKIIYDNQAVVFQAASWRLNRSASGSFAL